MLQLPGELGSLTPSGERPWSHFLSETVVVRTLPTSGFLQVGPSDRSTGYPHRRVSLPESSYHHQPARRIESRSRRELSVNPPVPPGPSLDGAYAGSSR